MAAKAVVQNLFDSRRARGVECGHENSKSNILASIQFFRIKHSECCQLECGKAGRKTGVELTSRELVRGFFRA